MSPALPAPGDRVRITATMPDDPDPLPVGTTGTVIHANADTGQIIVDWDTNRSLILLTTDPFEATTPTADTRATTTHETNPWPETTAEHVAFQDWQHEAANGDTAASFRNWLTAREDARRARPTIA